MVFPGEFIKVTSGFKVAVSMWLTTRAQAKSRPTHFLSHLYKQIQYYLAFIFKLLLFLLTRLPTEAKLCKSTCNNTLRQLIFLCFGI